MLRDPRTVEIHLENGGMGIKELSKEFAHYCFCCDSGRQSLLHQCLFNLDKLLTQTGRRIMYIIDCRLLGCSDLACHNCSKDRYTKRLKHVAGPVQ